jgi:hypothetical protein
VTWCHSSLFSIEAAWCLDYPILASLDATSCISNPQNLTVLQPKLYLAGSARDVATDPNVNIAIVTAGALAIAAIASGLIINFQSKPRGGCTAAPDCFWVLRLAWH